MSQLSTVNPCTQAVQLTKVKSIQCQIYPVDDTVITLYGSNKPYEAILYCLMSL